MQRARHDQRKTGNGGVKPSAFGFHQIDAGHGTGARGQIYITCVRKRIAGGDNGLFADNAIAAHFAHFAVSVRNFPLPRQNLQARFADIGDGNLVAETKFAAGDFYIGEIFGVDGDFNFRPLRGGNGGRFVYHVRIV